MKIDLSKSLFKAKPRKIKPAPRSLIEKSKARLTTKLQQYFRRMSLKVIPKVVGAYVKAGYGGAKKSVLHAILRKAQPTPEELVQRVELEGWDAIIDTVITPEIEAAFRAAGMSAVEATGVEVVSTMTGLVNETASRYAADTAADLVTQIPDTTRDMIRETVVQAIDNGWSHEELTDALIDSRAFSPERSALIAGYELGSALEAGNVLGWQASGVVSGKQWLTADDELVSDECQMNADQGVIPLDDQFQSGDDAPLAHPYAVFEGHSFLHYGGLHQFLRARYNGPAITIKAELDNNFVQFPPGNSGLLNDLFFGDIGRKEINNNGFLFIGDRQIPLSVELTIGTQHPMLTNRGFIKACDLKEGDKLIYDIRTNDAVTCSELDFKKVPMIEDAFDALRPIFSAPDVAAARTYFHGDEVFIYGEVETIRPTRNLLPVFDSCNIEHCSEITLKESDVSLSDKSGIGSDNLFSTGLDSTTCSGIGAGSENFSLFQSESRPEFFQVFTITRHDISLFSGYAYDASTATSLYAIEGFVVKNCRCSVVGITDSQEETDQEEE